jgi:ATP-dependent DNA helicase RecQ
MLTIKLKAFIDSHITTFFNSHTISKYSGSSDIKIFIEELEKNYNEQINETISFIQILKQLDENQNKRQNFYFDALKNIFYSPRKKAETEKAIYRLSLVGVIDDYTVDFNKNQFTLYVKKKSDREYKDYLFSFINKYFSEVKSTELISSIENYKGTSMIQKCLGFVIDFIYSQIADQRKLAISTMKEACYVGLESGNLEFKTFIDLYFNSKYARKNYSIDGKDYSLRSDIDNNNQLPQEIINKYIEAIKIDTGGEKNNLKHLRGACLVLQSAKIQNRENPTLLVLKAFCLLLLEYQNKKLLEEASNDFLNGFSKLFETYANFEQFMLFVTDFKGYLLTFSKEPIINNTIDNLIDILQIRIHTDWIEKFSPKFTEYYESTYSN